MRSAQYGAAAMVARRTSIVLALLALAACKGGARSDDAPALSKSADSQSASLLQTGAASTPVASAASSADEVDIPAPSGGPLVDLSGKVHLPGPIPEGAPRVAVRVMSVPVMARPDANAKVIGTLRAGAVVEADASEVGRAGCPGGWRGIKPIGFVCMGDKVTADLTDPIVKAVTRGPDITQKLPYMYGTVVRGGPVYSRIPSEDEMRKLEPGLAKHLQKWKEDEQSGASYGLELWFKWKKPPSYTAWEAWEQKLSDDDIPAYLKDGGSVPNLSGLAKPDLLKIDQVDRKQGVAFIDSFLVEGRRWNVSTDLRVMPADRFRPIKGSEHHGVAIGKDVEFPFALVRKKGGKAYTWSASKNKMIEDSDLVYREALQLTGKQKMVGGRLHYETKDGLWVDDRYASRLDPAKRMPKWGKNGEKWIDINITKQTLVAYEGEKPVYATLVSTGEDGLSEGEKTTKKGIFRIHTKHVSFTMDSDVVGEEFELRDVPYVQYFEGGLALHGAYWHDGFGTPKSHGCVNLAPEDARRLFYWTEPSVPAGWHGAAKPLTGTVLFIHP